MMPFYNALFSLNVLWFWSLFLSFWCLIFLNRMVLNDFIWILPKCECGATCNIPPSPSIIFSVIIIYLCRSSKRLIKIVFAMRICKRKRRRRKTNNDTQHKHMSTIAYNGILQNAKTEYAKWWDVSGREKNNKPWKEKYIFLLFVCFGVGFWLQISTIGSHLWSLLCFCYCYSCYDQWSSTFPAINVSFDLCLWLCFFFPSHSLLLLLVFFFLHHSCYLYVHCRSYLASCNAN